MGVDLRGLGAVVLLDVAVVRIAMEVVGILVAADSLVSGFGGCPCRVWSLLWNWELDDSVLGGFQLLSCVAYQV
jgi:hypothetical protein